LIDPEELERLQEELRLKEEIIEQKELQHREELLKLENEIAVITQNTNNINEVKETLKSLIQEESKALSYELTQVT
jgi:Trp operon repressor